MFTGRLYTVVLLLLLGLIGNAQEYGYHGVKIISSSIIIEGKTNINRFECYMDRPAVNDSILVKNIWSNNQIEFEGLHLQYSISDFECGIRAMNDDFQELLKASEEPFLYLDLNSILICPDNDSFEELNVDADVRILLAGVERKVKIEGGRVLNHSSAHLTLRGRKGMCMTDFGIDPPTKMFGMVKVTDDIQIEFEIGMEVTMLETRKAAQTSSSSIGSND